MCRKMPLPPFCLKVHAHANVGCIVNHSIHTVSSDVGYTQKLFTLWGYIILLYTGFVGVGVVGNGENQWALVSLMHLHSLPALSGVDDTPTTQSGTQALNKTTEIGIHAHPLKKLYICLNNLCNV